MNEEDFVFPSGDGRPLAGTRFDASTDAGVGPALLISSAMAVRRGFYAPFARAMAARGIPAMSYDYRGIGGSRQGPARRDPATMTEWATRDMAAAIGHARASFPDRSLVMLGHSAGGWMAGLCPEAAKLDGLVLIASQDGHWRHWRGARRVGLWGVWHVALPAATALWGYAPGWAGLGQDVPRGVAREWAAWGRQRRFIDGEADFARLEMAVLALSIDDDAYAPAAAVDALVARFVHDRVTRRLVSHREVGGPLGHFGYFRSEVGGRLWEEMADAIRGLPHPARS